MEIMTVCNWELRILSLRLLERMCKERMFGRGI